MDDTPKTPTLAMTRVDCESCGRQFRAVLRYKIACPVCDPAQHRLDAIEDTAVRHIIETGGKVTYDELSERLVEEHKADWHEQRHHIQRAIDWWQDEMPDAPSPAMPPLPQIKNA